MTSSRPTDGLVIGAGPAGATLAARLARGGARVVIAEAARLPRPKTCAEYASPRIAEELRLLGLAPADWRSAAVPIESMTVVAPRASVELRYADEGGERSAWGVDRARFDALLARHAAASGADLVEGAALTGLLRRDDGRVIGARIRTADGELEIRARVVVGADGARSRTARELGVERPVRWPRRLGLVAHYRGVDALRDRAEMHVGKGYYIGLAPTPSGELNVGMALPLLADGRSATARYESAIASLPAVAARLHASERVTRITGMAPIGQRVSAPAGPGWLLVGDAAGFIDPFTGEGIYRAIRGARAAATAIELALEGTGDTAASDAAVAERYRRERRRAFAAKDGVTWLVQSFLAVPPIFGYAVAQLGKRPHSAMRLGSVLGDLRPASDALSPAFLAGLLRP